ncbi:MAG: hypothetical protein ACRD3P_10815 [Terriglobales bacterium]
MRAKGQSLSSFNIRKSILDDANGALNAESHESGACATSFAIAAV